MLHALSWGLICLLVFTKTFSFVESDNESNVEKSLIRMLIQRYKTLGVVGRPVNDSRIKLVINYGLQMVQLLGFDENKQMLRSNCWILYKWNDPLLRWNSSKHGNIKVIQIYPHQIWTPDIKLYNFADERLDEYRKAGLLVSEDGSILWLQQALFKSLCQVDITYFPFDNQVCMFEFGSMTYDRTKLDMEWWIPDGDDSPMPYVDFSDYVPANDWYTDGETERDVHHTNRTFQIKSVKRYRVRMHMVGTKKEERYYTVLRYLIRIYRNPSFLLFILIAPCLLLSMLSLVVFWLPPNSSAKMMLGINIFVSFFVLLLLLAKSMPSSIKNFPLIGVFFCLNMVLVTLSTFLATWVVNLFYHGDQGEPVPNWIRRIIIDRVGYWVGIRQFIPLVDVNEQTTDPNQQLKILNNGEQYSYRSTYELDKSDKEIEEIGCQLVDHTQIIRQGLCELENKNARKNYKNRLGAEWRTLALIIDRICFVIYLITLIGTSVLVVSKTVVPDPTQYLINRNAVQLD